MTRRADVEAGPAPVFPQISPGRRGQPPPPPAPLPLASRDLELADFEMQGMDNNPMLDDRPFKWHELVKLAGEWGVALEEPPLPRIQLQVLLEVAPDAAGAPAQKAAYLGNRPNGSVAHRTVTVVATDGSVQIPQGYRAYDGTLALRLFRRLVTYEGNDDQFVFENQKGSLLLNGHKHDFKYFWQQTGDDDQQNISGLQWPTLIGFLIDRSQLARQHWLEGEIKLALATTFNGGACSLVLDCERTSAHALAWGRRMYALFAQAHRRRVEQYEDDKARAAERQLQWVRDAAGARARDIEKREIRRGVLSLLTENQLDGVGERVLSDSTDASEPLPAVPVTDLDELDNFARIVRFFEHAFDWSNMAYALHPYVYGRRSRWARLALAEHDDAQFGAFLGAGAARVQVPVRLGCETHVEQFFNGCGVHPFEKRIPPFDSMQSIGVELAEGASSGFVTGPGRVYVADGSREVVGVGTVFRDPEDLDREIRLNGRIHVVEEVFGATRLRLRTPYAGPALVRAVYGIGGIVVGEAMTLILPTTLVAIDKPGLALPEFPPRYAS
jgi:hypothetical protein